MPTYIALLRGINVGGRNKIPMADLREMFASVGFREARTLLQSGNVVFDGLRQSNATLEQLLEAETQARLKFSIDYVVRTATEWKKIITGNPFAAEAKESPSHMVVMCLKTPARSSAVRKLNDEIAGREIVQASGKQLYMVYPDGIGRSKLTNAIIEKKLNVRGTARNWNTVMKLELLTVEV